MSRRWIQLATFAAYLPSAALPVLAEGGRTRVGGSLDPSVLVVPFCLAFAAGFPFWGRRPIAWRPSASSCWRLA